MDESRYDSLAEQTLSAFLDVLDEAIGDVAEVEFDSGILTITLDAGGQFVINKQRPTRQIWMSSPVSGASHFVYDEEEKSWVSTRSDARLAALLAEDVKRKTGISVAL